MNRVSTSWGFVYYRVNKPRGGARGPGPREWGPRGSLTVHGGPGARGLRRPAPWVPRVSRTRGRGRLTAGPHMVAAGRARRRPRRHSRWEAAHPRPNGRRRRPPARRSGARERGGKGEVKRRSTAHPGSTATTGTATGAEEGGGAARIDGDGGVPAIGDRNGEVDEVGEVAANLKKAMPKREMVRGNDGGEPELGGDGGERGRRRELDSDGERERRVAETVEGGTGSVYIGLGVSEGGRRGRKPARRSRAPSMAPARFAGVFPNESEGEREREKWGKRERESRGVISPSLLRAGTAGCGEIRGGGGARARARRRERREVGDDGWAPPVSEGGGRARPSAARARGGFRMGRGEEEREGEGDEPSRPKRGRGGKRTF
uniref:Pr1-like protein n=1 Tax=Oryza sativa subsp. japonica TaxID=39947 RepID=Q5Z531_ORYSJ|nr:pr1-like protein [Oryza sativa Japonica Group]BAD62163.1 pr1-like protein [Oryza sativa Japonica Group]